MGNQESVEEVPPVPIGQEAPPGGVDKQWKAVDVASIAESTSTADGTCDCGDLRGSDNGIGAAESASSPRVRLSSAAAEVAGTAAPVSATVSEHLGSLAEMFSIGKSEGAVSATAEIRKNFSSYMSMAAVRDMFSGEDPGTENSSEKSVKEEPDEQEPPILESYVSLGLDGIRRLFSGQFFQVSSHDSKNPEEENSTLVTDSDMGDQRGSLVDVQTPISQAVRNDAKCETPEARKSETEKVIFEDVVGEEVLGKCEEGNEDSIIPEPENDSKCRSAVYPPDKAVESKCSHETQVKEAMEGVSTERYGSEGLNPHQRNSNAWHGETPAVSTQTSSSVSVTGKPQRATAMHATKDTKSASQYESSNEK